MAYLNNVQLIGNVGNDPDVRYLDREGTGNQKFATFKVATTKRFRDRNNEQHEQTQWHTCTCFGNIADVVEKYIKKGSSVFVSGELSYRKWQDKDGLDHYSTEIKLFTVQMLDKRQKDAPEIVTNDKEPGDFPF